MENYEEYEDMIYMPHYQPKRHARMSLRSRSAQFAPFAALTGFEEEIEKTRKRVEENVEENNFYDIIKK